MANRPRIVCLGGNLESETCLTDLIEHTANVVGCLCASDDIKHEISDFADIASLAESNGIPCLPISDINGPEATDFLREQRPDWVFVLGWSQILHKDTLAIPTHGVIGSHPSCLPSGRGRAPIPWAILEDREQGGVSLFRMTEGIDKGDVYAIKRFTIPRRAYASDLYQLTSAALSEAFITLYSQLQTGVPEPVPTVAENSSIYAKRIRQDGLIDFAQPAEMIDRLVRAVAPPYPCAYTYHHDELLSFDSIQLAERKDHQSHGVIGQVLAKRGCLLLVQSGTEPLWLGINRARHPTLSIPLGSVLGYRVQDEINHLKKTIANLEQRLAELSHD